LDGSILWADEVVLNFMVLMVMFGAPAVTRRMLHTDLKMFVDFLPRPVGRIIRIITTTIGFLFLSIFLYAAAKYTFDARGMWTTVLKIPMPYMYSIMLFGSLLLLYEYIKTIPLSLKDRR
jgi:TRAP-type C4-dicarboxylate transport system permease small subunit